MYPMYSYDPSYSLDLQRFSQVTSQSYIKESTFLSDIHRLIVGKKNPTTEYTLFLPNPHRHRHPQGKSRHCAGQRPPDLPPPPPAAVAAAAQQRLSMTSSPPPSILQTSAAMWAAELLE